jgi:hypothetical protein
MTTPKEQRNTELSEPVEGEAVDAVAWMYRYVTSGGFETQWALTMDAKIIEAIQRERDDFTVDVVALGPVKPPPSCNAVVAVALMKAADVMRSSEGGDPETDYAVGVLKGYEIMRGRILASIPADHMQAVMELMDDGVKAGIEEAGSAAFAGSLGKKLRDKSFDTEAIVTRILAEKGLV